MRNATAYLRCVKQASTCERRLARGAALGRRSRTSRDRNRNVPSARPPHAERRPRTPRTARPLSWQRNGSQERTAARAGRLPHRPRVQLEIWRTRKLHHHHRSPSRFSLALTLACRSSSGEIKDAEVIGLARITWAAAPPTWLSRDGHSRTELGTRSDRRSGVRIASRRNIAGSRGPALQHALDCRL